MSFLPAVVSHQRSWWTRTKKADVAERPKAFDHVGLLVNGLPGMAGSPFI